MSRWLAFALAAFVFHQLPAVAGNAGTWIDLLTPFAVVGAAAWALRGASSSSLALGVAAAIAYVDGHGIHLSANDIGHQHAAGDVERVRHFWDERWGHIEWHLGWLALLAALALADDRPGRPSRASLAGAVILGATLFTSTVEGQDWFLTLGAAGAFSGWALLRPCRGAATVACTSLVGTALIGVWAAWHGGVPQFSELGWL